MARGEAGDALTALLAGLEAELHHPGRACARARLEQLLHPDFHEVGRSGARYDRATVIDFLASDPARAPIRAGGYRVQRLGAGRALLHYHSVQTGDDGMRINAALRSSLWTCSPRGRWQLFYHQGTPVSGHAAGRVSLWPGLSRSCRSAPAAAR